MSDETNKEILKELQMINEKLDKLEDREYISRSRFIMNCILIFGLVFMLTLLISFLPAFFL